MPDPLPSSFIIRVMTSPHRLCIAPMMERTDRHFRYLMRLIAPHARLYTEMLTARALLRGDCARLLAFHADEHPVALQLGGSEPAELAAAAKLGEAAGYDEINLNVGCPSSRVQAGCFGVALMLRARARRALRCRDARRRCGSRHGQDAHRRRSRGLATSFCTRSSPRSSGRLPNDRRCMLARPGSAA